MKKIYFVGFRGTGFQDKEYRGEPALIRAGHVGIIFENEPSMILGFHPTAEAIAEIGSEDDAIEWLKENEPLEGSLQEDYEIFYRAFELQRQGARTEIWQITIEVSEEDFARIHAQALEWYTKEEKFTYAFPPIGKPPLPERDNCATFPRRLGLPLPEPTGQLTRYIEALKNIGTQWKPEES